MDMRLIANIMILWLHDFFFGNSTRCLNQNCNETKLPHVLIDSIIPNS